MARKEDASESKKKRFMNTAKRLLRSRKIVAIFLVLLLIAGFIIWKVLGNKKQEPQYETAKAEVGTLVTSVSGSGDITSGNSTSVTTKAAGVVKTVYVTNGDTVSKGQRIAEVTLDDYAAERQTSAWVSYLDTLEAVKTAEKNKIDDDIQVLTDQQAILNAADDVSHKKNDEDADYTDYEKDTFDKTLEQAKKALEVSELKYKNAGSSIQAANTKVAAAWRNYQENSATIYASTSGIISDLTLAPNLVINASSATSSSTGATIVSAQTIGKIGNPEGRLIATISLTEIDIINVKANQKVTLTLDAYPDKTFTGKVLAINTAGSVSSGVTSYPVSIILDPAAVDIYPHMAVNANIILSVKNDIVLVPSAAVQISNNQSTVKVMRNGQVVSVPVEIGSNNDTQTEIVSGLNEGDVVVVGVTNPSGSTTQSQGGVSPFSSFGGGRGAGTTIRGVGRD